MASQARFYDRLTKTAVTAFSNERPDVALTASFKAIASGSPCSASPSIYEQALPFTGEGSSMIRHRLHLLMAAENGAPTPQWLNFDVTTVELHHMEVQRRLAALRVSIAGETNSHRISFLQRLRRCYALSQLHRISSDTTLRNGASPWLIGCLLQLLMDEGAENNMQASFSFRSPGQDLQNCLCASDLVSHQVTEIENEVRSVSSQFHEQEVVRQIVRPFGPIFHRRLVQALFHSPEGRRRDAWSDFPDDVRASPFPTTWSLEGLIRRTMRDDVPRGVIIPDSRFAVDDFPLLLSLSQHREVILTSHSLTTMTLEANPHNMDGSKRNATTAALKKLLHAVTTDATVAEGHGGVTLLSPDEELFTKAWESCSPLAPLVQASCRIKEIFFSASTSEVDELRARYCQQRQPRKYRTDPISKVVIATRDSEVRTQCLLSGLEVFP